MTTRNLIFTGYLLFVSTTALFAQHRKHKTDAIEIGHIVTIKSNILNEERQIYVSLPTGYDTMTYSLPVIYVLDAEYRFGIAQSIQSYFNMTTEFQSQF